MMKKLSKWGVGTAMAVALSLGGFAHADVITHWNFNNAGDPPNVWPSPIAASSGSGTLTYDFTTDRVVTFAGSALNAVGSDPSGGSFSVQVGDDDINLGGSLVINANTTGYQNIVLSYATRGTSSGFDTHRVEYSTNGGGSWTEHPDSPIDGRTDTSFSVQSFSLASVPAINNNSSAAFRITLLRENNVEGTTPTGNNRIDNLRVDGDIFDPSADYSFSGTTANFGLVDANQGPFEHTVTISADNAVTVNAPASPPAGLSVSPSSLSIGAGQSDSFTVSWNPAANDGTELNTSITFTSSNNPSSFDVDLTGSTADGELTIAAARALQESGGSGTYVVSGIVASNTLGASNRNTVTIQDRVDGDSSTRGIQIDDFGGVGRGSGNPLPAIGDEVTLIGTLGQFAGLVQIVPVSEYTVTPGVESLINPVVISSSALGDDTESVLIRINNATVAADVNAPRSSNTTMNDGVDFTLRVDNNPNFDSFEDTANLLSTSTYSITGIGGQNDGTNPPTGGVGYQIRPRNINDIDGILSVSDWLLH